MHYKKDSKGMLSLNKYTMNEVFLLARDYLVKFKHPSLEGLWFYLINRTDGDLKDSEVLTALTLLQGWFEDQEKYEQCHIIQQILKEHETKNSQDLRRRRINR